MLRQRERCWRPQCGRCSIASRADALHVDLGIGKTTTLLRLVAEKLDQMRNKRNKRAIVFAVPTLKLNEEVTAKFNALGAHSASGWRGRRAPDLDRPGETMCRNLEAAREISEAGASV